MPDEVFSDIDPSEVPITLGFTAPVPPGLIPWSWKISGEGRLNDDPALGNAAGQHFLRVDFAMSNNGMAIVGLDQQWQHLMDALARRITGLETVRTLDTSAIPDLTQLDPFRRH